MEEENQNTTFNIDSIPQEYKPVSLGAFLGYQLLFMIPCVGIICAIVFACGAINNINVKNWARAYLLVVLIVFVLYFLLVLFGLGTYIMSAASGAV